ncbi:IS1 family transposase [archaeon]|nr:IS1 family transposase [archaeon]
MARPRSKNDVVCQNKACAFYRKEKGKDIVRRGCNKAGTQRYLCLHCNKYLVDTKGTPMYRRRFDKRKIRQLCKLLVEKNGVRSIARVMNINKNTAVNWLDNLATHAMNVTDFLVENLGLDAVEVDEFWTTVKKNKRRLSVKALKEIAKATHGHTPA